MATVHQPTITETADGIAVATCVPIAHGYTFEPEVFSTSSKAIAGMYRAQGRCLCLVDTNVYKLLDTKIEEYFKHHSIRAVVRSVDVTEERKDLEKLSEVCKMFVEYDLFRREPVLVVGGGLMTDVLGFACAVFRRGTPYIRVPTTLIGLIDASVSNRVAVNWNGLKNRLGGYHEPVHTIIDYTFLKYLPAAEIRNGLAEILKITSCVDLKTFRAVQAYGLDLIATKFFLTNGFRQEQAALSNEIIRAAIIDVLREEVPNCREANLDRVMFFGHTWSPVLELAPKPVLLHGHAISVDMCYSISISQVLGHIDEEHANEFLKVFSDLGLALDHPAFTEELMLKATASTIATRDGKLRAPIPTGKLGEYEILANVSEDVLKKAWALHKERVKEFPREGLGIDPNTSVRS
ncbi:Dehydroquinate synthase-like protein [Lindgomyces ingoldianus]|uniref:Dehydroquinate synthase-like protein n=1 Tax=Lindgomyces ingoldianus TaxID=673940 RepID=A0ACB6QKF6_9PLEO|nr:Dehydroquinate synthase-like protein [Lindgomyces ingoldianus]KAF2466625.1 Dehydroquinate synthase-like protein [Lindgomyces ingoldianus]